MFEKIKNILTGTDNMQVSEAVSEGAFLVDVRTPGEFSSGSVDGAKNIPLNDIVNRINEFKHKENIIVFCRSGNRSKQAKGILEQNGVQNVLNGGSWKNVDRIKVKNER